MAALASCSRGLAAIGAVSAMLGACAEAPQPVFDLHAPREGLGVSRSQRIIVVAEPQALAALDSSRMLITTGEGALNYLPGGAWSDRLPKLFQVRLIQSFENAKRIAGVGRPGDRLVPEAQLNSEIRRFGIEESSGEAVVEMAVKIVDDRSGRIVAGKIFTSRSPAPEGNTAAGAHRAFDLAAQEVMRQIVAWVAGRF